MSVTINGGMAHLSGDWTVGSLTMCKVELLSDVLKQVGDGHDSRLMVDCGDMTATDRAGLELLHVWIQCASLCGFEIELINLPITSQTPAIEALNTVRV